MSRSFQIALARLYTDSEAREHLYAGTTSALAGLGLGADELATLTAFAQESRERLELYASILVKKRGTPLKKQLPVLYEVLQAAESEGWGRMWSEFYATVGAGETDDLPHQAERLVAHVAMRADSFGAWQHVVSEAARYERTKLALPVAHRGAEGGSSSREEGRDGCPRVPGPFVLEAFAYDLASIKSQPSASGLPRPSPTTVLFCRHAIDGSVVVARVAKAMARVIALCDGRSTREEIAARLEGAGGLSVASVAAVVSVLAARGIVAQDRGGRGHA